MSEFCKKKIFILNCVGLNISVPDREGRELPCHGFRKLKAGHLSLKGNWEIFEQLVCFDFKALPTLAHLWSVAFAGSKKGCSPF